MYEIGTRYEVPFIVVWAKLTLEKWLYERQLKHSYLKQLATKVRDWHYETPYIIEDLQDPIIDWLIDTQIKDLPTVSAQALKFNDICETWTGLLRDKFATRIEKKGLLVGYTIFRQCTRSKCKRLHDDDGYEFGNCNHGLRLIAKRQNEDDEYERRFGCPPPGRLRDGR